MPEVPDASSFENKELIIFLIKFRYSYMGKKKLFKTEDTIRKEWKRNGWCQDKLISFGSSAEKRC